jgi:multicomponent Na+:H+ antiporter subunit E
MSRENGSALARGLALVGTLYAFWLAMSGIYTPFLLAAGLVTALAVAALAWRMEVADREGHPVHLTLAALGYWPWLVKEIVKAGLQVSRIVLDPRLPVSPTLVRFKPSQRSTVGLVTHANSITLTPGTITIEASRQEFLVHALTRAAGAGLAGSEMDRRVSRFEGSA